MRKSRIGSIWKLKRLLLETIVGYCAAVNNTTLDQFPRGENAQ